IDALVSIRMGAAHESVTYESDAERVFRCCHQNRVLFLPAMPVAHVDHGRKNRVPGSGLVHDTVRKHAAIPADMTEHSRHLSAIIAHPKACGPYDVQLAIRVVRQAVMAGLIV